MRLSLQPIAATDSATPAPMIQFTELRISRSSTSTPAHRNDQPAVEINKWRPTDWQNVSIVNAGRMAIKCRRRPERKACRHSTPSPRTRYTPTGLASVTPCTWQDQSPTDGVCYGTSHAWHVVEGQTGQERAWISSAVQ